MSILPVFAGARTPLQTPQDAEELRRWLTRQDAEDLPDYLNRLHDSVIAQQQDIPEASTQLGLLRCYLSHIQKAGQELRANNFALSLPLPNEAIEIAELMSNIYLQMANAYKTVVLHAADDSAANNILDAGDLAVACYGSMHYLSQMLYTAYQGYRPYPDGTWYEIHQLFQYARAEEIFKHPVRSFSIFGKDTDSFSACYKRALMLELADPYRMQYGIVDGVHKALHDWVDKIQIIDAVPAQARSCMFLTDLEFDKAGIPLLPKTAVQPGPRHLIIDTASLVAQLHGQYEATVGMPDENQRELLRTLIVQWGVQPMRSMERRPVKKDCEIIVGIDSIDFMIGLDRFEQSHQSDAAAEVVADAKEHDPHYPQSTHWEIVDESLGGMQIVASGKADTRITVGELVGVRLPSTSLCWQIGAVRWVKHHDVSRSNMGINILGTTKVQVTLSGAGKNNDAAEVDNRKDSDKTLAVLLETNADEDSESRIVCRSGNLAQGMVVSAHDGEKTLDIKIGKIIASTKNSDCFVYQRA